MATVRLGFILVEIGSVRFNVTPGAFLDYARHHYWFLSWNDALVFSALRTSGGANLTFAPPPCPASTVQMKLILIFGFTACDALFHFCRDAIS